MKLYQYHHCPYCVRADMVANYKNVQHEKVYLLNDDEQSCYDLVNAKMVPILQLDNGTAMGESLDIVAKLDEVGDTSKVIAPKATGDEIDAMFAAIKTSTRILTYPRTILIGLPEFATQSACDYFQAKKEKMIEMSFAQAMMMSEKHIEIVNQVLATLPSFSISAVLSMDDILTFPILRNLSMVKGVVFTANTLSYIQHIAALTRSETYFAKAI
ncbi:MAG: glutaredoxin 2 [Paraglaciecola sp.]|uniref:glutaredoxin 2 n=1 Tax=Pseudomonadati TaxID=3379134 RepID=UPI00273EB33E|nr:glutaredoxin 2 [Paraglaciecola sp.]MDP5031883.1 glutaredoxin 2 [Paraglaciecola sp.]MDP5133303.1 glutaredoxin 2 [Paraglaciecola sp.]